MEKKKTAKTAVTQKKSNDLYSKFDGLDGSHPLKSLLPDSYILYKARTRKGGKVIYFNYELGKEMGLIPKSHPHELTEALEQKILDQFALVIINEYDKQNGIKFKPEDIKPGTYMATRYLQPQHNDNIGLHSGDGRSIWNGIVKHQGKTWDISSRGTGATQLSPATTKYGKYFQSGDPTISYGCGYAEIDEAIESVFFSEVFHRNKVKTERTLAVIEFEKGLVVSVRAHENLLRPSHLFRHIKQGKLCSLKKMLEYYINRQESNGRWTGVPVDEKDRWEYFLEKQMDTFAETSAQFEDDYIFCWLDWDGDNVLMDGGIIDYGSIRQFGMYHHGYQFDDDGKFSITIAQQKNKAKYIVQTFAQMIDALINNKKRPIAEFSNHKILEAFDKKFEEYKDKNIIRKIGFTDDLINSLATDPVTKKFRKSFSFWERIQARAGEYKVTDGISHDAVFCMRDILRELPQLLMTNYQPISSEEFIEIIKSSYAKKEDLFLNSNRNDHIHKFQKYYIALIEKAAELKSCSVPEMLLQITMRSSVINKYDRITGDAITIVAEKVLKTRPKLSNNEIYHILEAFIIYQDLNPDKEKGERKLTEREKKLMRALFLIVKDCREGL